MKFLLLNKSIKQYINNFGKYSLTNNNLIYIRNEYIIWHTLLFNIFKNNSYYLLDKCFEYYPNNMYNYLFNNSQYEYILYMNDNDSKFSDRFGSSTLKQYYCFAFLSSISTSEFMLYCIKKYIKPSNIYKILDNYNEIIKQDSFTLQIKFDRLRLSENFIILCDYTLNNVKSIEEYKIHNFYYYPLIYFKRYVENFWKTPKLKTLFIEFFKNNKINIWIYLQIYLVEFNYFEIFKKLISLDECELEINYDNDTDSKYRSLDYQHYRNLSAFSVINTIEDKIRCYKYEMHKMDRKKRKISNTNLDSDTESDSDTNSDHYNTMIRYLIGIKKLYIRKVKNIL